MKIYNYNYWVRVRIIEIGTLNEKEHYMPLHKALESKEINTLITETDPEFIIEIDLMHNSKEVFLRNWPEDLKNKISQYSDLMSYKDGFSNY